MSRYRYELATAADDADLRHVLAATPMGGAVSVAFRREPSFFAAARTDGHFRQVVVARDVDTGRVISFGMANRWGFEALGRVLPLDGRGGSPTLAAYAHAFTGPALTGWLVLAASAAALTLATVRVLQRRS